MPFDLVAFGEAAPGANGTLAVGLADTLYRVSGDDLFVKNQAPYLLGVHAAMESTGALAKLRQPTLPTDHEFHKVSLLSADDPALGYTHLFGRPLPLIPLEKLNVITKNATDEDAIVGLLLGSGKITQDMLDAVNPTHIITGLADTTMTAFTWGALTMTWAQDLPSGKYCVVGMKYGYFLASPAAAMPSYARLIFKEGPKFRPGVVGIEAQADHKEIQTATYHPWEHWPLMSELYFEHDELPTVEVCSAEAHTDENIELLLQKIE